MQPTFLYFVHLRFFRLWGHRWCFSLGIFHWQRLEQDLYALYFIRSLQIGRSRMRNRGLLQYGPIFLSVSIRFEFMISVFPYERNLCDCSRASIWWSLKIFWGVCHIQKRNRAHSFKAIQKKSYAESVPIYEKKWPERKSAGSGGRRQNDNAIN